jgi:hypothetical protein
VKASLVSATSLIALLIADGGAANAAAISVSSQSNPVTIFALVGGSAGSATSLITATGTNGETASGLSLSSVTNSAFSAVLGTQTKSGNNDSATATFTFAAPTVTGTASTTITATGSFQGSHTTTTAITLTGTGVAPIEAVSSSSGSVDFVRVGTTATSTVTISNIGNGNLATGGPSSTSNLNGTVNVTLAAGAAAGTNSGNGSTFSLRDTTSGAPAGANTSTLTYTYTPTAVTSGTVTTSVNLAFSDGSANGRNTSTAASSVFVYQAVGPQFALATNSTSSATGGKNIALTSTGTGGAVAATNGTISFGSVGFGKSSTLWLDISNLATSPSGAAAALTNLSIENFSISGGSAADYSISGAATIAAGGEIEIPITVTDNAPGTGLLNSTLTIFTDEGAANGGTGDTFSFALTASAVPEPASMAIVGAGLAGLAGLRRRRKALNS